jgi:hypothetical protein
MMTLPQLRYCRYFKTADIGNQLPKPNLGRGKHLLAFFGCTEGSIAKNTRAAPITAEPSCRGCAEEK